MDASLAYPASAMRWAVDAQNHDLPSSVFKSIVVANGLRVLLERDLPDAREQLRADSIPGQRILWSEDDDCRSLLFSDEGSGSIVLIIQAVAEVEISVASNDLEAARKIVKEIDAALAREQPKDATTLPIAFWHLSPDGAETTTRQIELTRWTDIASNYVGDTKTRLAGR